MNVELKIWRYDGSTGERALKQYAVDVSDEATLLDTLESAPDTDPFVGPDQAALEALLAQFEPAAS